MTNTLYIVKRILAMTPKLAALALAALVLNVALLAIADIVPAVYAQYAPLAAFAVLPWAVRHKDRDCPTCARKI